MAKNYDGLFDVLGYEPFRYKGIERQKKNISYDIETPFVAYDSITKLGESLLEQNKRIMLKKEKKMIDKKKMNKFYVASPHISEPVARGENARWTRKTLAEATKHAQELLNAQPHKEVMLIVKVVRIVKRADTPVVIEDVK